MRAQRLRIARRHGCLKGRGKPVAVFARRRKARPAGFDMSAGAGRELAAGRLAATECARHFGEVEAEDVVQQEARPLQRRQPFEHQHQRHRNIVRQLARRLVVEDFVDHRLGQPLADVELAPRLRRLHAIEAEPRHHGAEIAARLLDRRAVGGVPAQIGVLHDVLGLGARAEHAVGKPGQRAPMRLERRDVLVERRAHAAEALAIGCVTSRNTGRVSPPIVSRVQAWP